MAVTTRKTIQRLTAYNGSPSPILSLYLTLPQTTKEKHPSLNHSFQKLIDEMMTPYGKSTMKQNIQYMKGFLESYVQNGSDKTVALFSGGDTLFDVLHIPYETPSTLVVTHSPYLEPLIQAKNGSGRYLVILNDRRKVILYTLNSGTLEDRKVLEFDDVPEDTKGRWANAPRAQRNDKQQRHVNYHLKQHFDEVAGKAQEFVARKPITGVILGGHMTEMNQFEQHLPKPMQQKVIGKFVSELKVNFNEIVDKSKKIIEEAHDREAHSINLTS